MHKKVEFFRHNIGDEEIAGVTDVLKSIFLTTGERVLQFEEELGHYLGISHCIGLTSATAGLHLSLLACGIGPGDEVITTPLSFVASANAILMAGATSVFVDVERETANINADLLEGAVTKSTKAILPAHLYGNMCDMKKIREVADKFGLAIIEDAAHALESERDGVKPGRLGETATFSFYATKSITSGEGGATVTGDPSIAEKLKILRLHGISTEAHERYTRKYCHYDMTMLGWKYNMDNVQAALLIPQLRKAGSYLARREEIARQYEKAMEAMGVGFPRVPAGAKSGRHLFTIWVRPELRDPLLWSLQERNVGVAVNFRAIHLMSYYRERYGFTRGMFPEAERIGDSTLTLPLYPQLSNEEVEYVIHSVGESLDSLRKGN